MEVQTERVEITVEGGGVMGGYLARPVEGTSHPAVLVFMEIFGVNSHIRDVTERIAGEGYVALAPDYFHRSGPGVELAYDDDGMAEGMKLLGALQADEMILDARAALGAVLCVAAYGADAAPVLLLAARQALLDQCRAIPRGTWRRWR